PSRGARHAGDRAVLDDLAHAEDAQRVLLGADAERQVLRVLRARREGLHGLLPQNRVKSASAAWPEPLAPAARPGTGPGTRFTGATARRETATGAGIGVVVIGK